MLAIRMQRIGRKGYPMYRMIVQESHRQPTSGRVVANLGSYNPHTKETQLNKEKAELFLKNGAQPSDRVVKVLMDEKVALPDWVVKTATNKQKTIRNIEKLRRNQPAEEAPAPEEAVVAEEAPVEAPVESIKASEVSESTDKA